MITHPAFFLAESSVAVTNPTTFQTIIKNRIQITKYNIILINGYNIFSYKAEANSTQLGWLVKLLFVNSSVIIPLSPTNHSAKNLADTIIMIHIIPNITNLIHSFNESSLSDVIIL
jgi:hypothetical protein